MSNKTKRPMTQRFAMKRRLDKATGCQEDCPASEVEPRPMKTNEMEQLRAERDAALALADATQAELAAERERHHATAGRVERLTAALRSSLATNQAALPALPNWGGGIGKREGPYWDDFRRDSAALAATAEPVRCAECAGYGVGHAAGCLVRSESLGMCATCGRPIGSCACHIAATAEPATPLVIKSGPLTDAEVAAIRADDGRREADLRAARREAHSRYMDSLDVCGQPCSPVDVCCESAPTYSADDLRKVAEHSAAAKQAVRSAVRSVLHGFSALDHLEEIDAIIAKAVKS